MFCLKCDSCGRVSSKKGVRLHEEYRVRIKVGNYRPTVVMYVTRSDGRRRRGYKARQIDLCSKCLMAALRKALALRTTK